MTHGTGVAWSRQVTMGDAYTPACVGGDQGRISRVMCVKFCKIAGL